MYVQCIETPATGRGDCDDVAPAIVWILAAPDRQPA
jgi:hypothetical protein